MERNKDCPHSENSIFIPVACYSCHLRFANNSKCELGTDNNYKGLQNSNTIKIK